MRVVCGPVALALGAAASLLLPGCGRVGYELLGGAESPAVPGDGGGAAVGDAAPRGDGGASNAGAGGAATGGVATDASGSGGVDAGSGAAPSAGGTASSGGAANDGAVPDGAPGSGGHVDSGAGADDAGRTDGGVPPLGEPAVDCKDGLTLSRLFTFAAGDGWFQRLSGGATASLTFVATPGNQEPGSADFDVTAPGPDGRQWFEVTPPEQALGGHTVYGAVWLDGDVAVTAKLFVQTNGGSVWLDGGTLTLTPHAWTCMKTIVDAPDYASGPYDPNTVVTIGFEVWSASPFRVYFDDVGY